VQDATGVAQHAKSWHTLVLDPLDHAELYGVVGHRPEAIAGDHIVNPRLRKLDVG